MAKQLLVAKKSVVKKKRKGIHSKNASKGQSGYKQVYRGQGKIN